jgi:hypothetical protein
VAVGIAVGAAISYIPRTDEVAALQPPVIAPDGRYVTVLGTERKGPDRGTLWTVDTTTGEVACIARGFAHFPAWIDGGERLAFLWDDYQSDSTLWEGPPPSCRAIWTAAPDGRRLRRIALADWEVGGLNVSPDGRWAIAGPRRPISSGGETTSTLIPLAGGAAPHRDVPGYPAGWVSHGGRLQVLTAVARPGPLPGTEDDSALMLWDAESGVLGDETIARSPLGVIRLSPDGAWLAAMVAQTDGKPGTERTRIIRMARPKRAPVVAAGRPLRWHPRAEAVALQRLRPGSATKSHIAFVDPVTGHEVGRLPFVSQYMPFLAWAPSGDRLICAPWGSADATLTQPRLASWPSLDERTIEVPGNVVGWCSNTELVTFGGVRVWKVNVDTGERTLLFPPA